jgi:NodT family efflux transporter outer membrane factor (OMF) lipoprotein
MARLPRPTLTALAVAAVVVLALSGCTGPREYVRNGFKVGPNYCRPPAPVARQWIDAADVSHVRQESEDLSRWWAVLNDPVLNRLMTYAYRQNLTLREAGFRVLQARAQRGIAVGGLFPQQQDMFGSYRRIGSSLNPPTNGPFLGDRYFDQWAFGFNLAWELDFWGRFRRAVAAAEDQLNASVEDYDFVLVTLLGDIAANYVQIRTDQERIRLLQENVRVEKGVLEIVQTKAERGKDSNAVDVAQAKSTLAQTWAQIPPVEIDLRQANDRLCTLLGIPPEDLTSGPATPENPCKIGIGPIPTVQPPEIVVGMPAELLRRRPDVRRAERLAAAQAEQIGIAQADLYPAFSINGTLGYQAKQFSHLFTPDAFNGSVGPSFQWNILNYGRIVNNVRLQDARFQELAVAYQNTVLQANEEVEEGIVTFLQALERRKRLGESVEFTRLARNLSLTWWEVGPAAAPGLAGRGDFNRYSVIEQNLIQQEDLQAQAQGQIVQGLIQVYRALGGGWQIRLLPEWTMPPVPAMPPVAPQGPERLPVPPQGLELPKEPAIKPEPNAGQPG